MEVFLLSNAAQDYVSQRLAGPLLVLRPKWQREGLFAFEVVAAVCAVVNVLLWS